ncbi:MAG TPA: glycoside hydrolase family 30 beta sandwich domain-containing protein [Acidimicrobiales bacterium]|nr:glycoside hydrolase family 30 beta sandwich domain-containing protein [Acidimicrobiales bacterium]
MLKRGQPVEERPTRPGAVGVWLTTADQEHLLARQPDVHFGGVALGGITVTIDDRHELQPMVGFGASFTESAAVLVHDRLEAAARSEVMERLFRPDRGIGLSLLRQPMGATDFALGNYTYDDVAEPDPELTAFSVARDDDAVVPLIVEALHLNPRLRVMATPWSAPAWMKSSRSLIGGTLAPEAYGTYARYFVRFVEAYAARGIPVWAVTAQNEPHFSPAGYPGMVLTPVQEAEFVGRHLGPALAAAGTGTRILAFDGNWDGTDHALQVLRDPVAGPYLAGVAFHCYAGDPTCQDEVRERHPDKAILVTECSGGGWSTDFAANLRWGVHTLIVEAVRHGASAVVLWNMALDQNWGPTNGGCQDCRGVVTVDTATGRVEYNVEYFVLGHASKFLAPGAVHLPSATDGDTGIESVAFRNSDGTHVLIALNSAGEAQTFGVTCSARSFAYHLPAGAVATFCWAEGPP